MYLLYYETKPRNKNKPFCKQWEHPKNPLYCTAFRTSVFAGRSHVQQMSARRQMKGSRVWGDIRIPENVMYTYTPGGGGYTFIVEFGKGLCQWPQKQSHVRFAGPVPHPTQQSVLLRKSAKYNLLHPWQVHTLWMVWGESQWNYVRPVAYNWMPPSYCRILRCLKLFYISSTSSCFKASDKADTTFGCHKKLMCNRMVSKR